MIWPQGVRTIQRALAGDVIGAWGETLETTRELLPVLVSADGKTLIDRAMWVEDARGGYYTLASGNPVLGANDNYFELLMA